MGTGPALVVLGMMGRIPVAGVTWQALQWSAMNVGPNPQSPLSETMDAHCR